MNKTASFVLLGIALLIPSITVQAQRSRNLIDSDWRFQMDTTNSSVVIDGPKIDYWKWTLIDKDTADIAKLTSPGYDMSGEEWKTVKSGEDVFKGWPGFMVFRKQIDTLAEGRRPRKIYFQYVDDNATVYLNGKLLMEHSGWNEPFYVDPQPGWRDGGPNVLTVVVENLAGAGGIGKTILMYSEPVAPNSAKNSTDTPAWKSVHLPHDFVVAGKFDSRNDGSHGYLPFGVAWYRKAIEIPASAREKRIWLEFDGVYRNSTVWVNEHEAGKHECGYSSFQVDITPFVKYGAMNNIAVHVDARKPEGWWYEGGGIYRHVWLCMANRVSVAQYGTFVASKVSGLNAEEIPSARLTIKTKLNNTTSKGVTVKVKSVVTRPDGKIVAQVVSPATIPAKKDLEITQNVNEPQAKLWSIETPNMYRLHTVVTLAGKTIDTYDTPFGIRSIQYDPNKGFLLNGKPVMMKGTCNHQDFAGIGVALPDSILSWRIRRLKEMGSNAYRTSHNQVASELLDACDTQGMLVMDESRHLGDGEAGKGGYDTKAVELSNLHEQILRDRNHPSVVMWSMCNEEPLQGDDYGAELFKSMMNEVRKYDTTRPITSGMNGGFGGGFSKVQDLQGFNYNIWAIDRFRKDHPKMPMYGSETASALSTRGVYTLDPFDYSGAQEYGDEGNVWVAAYDLNRPPWGNTAEDAWKAIADRPYMFGTFVWTGFDYRGEPTPFGWPAVNSAFGIMDMCGFSKDSYYYYQSVWGDKPMVHLLPHWNWQGKEGQPIDVWAFSNGEKVELLLNGKSLGVKDMPKNGHLSWSVPYRSGKLEAKAIANNQVIATDAVETTGKPAAIRLKTDIPVLKANGEEESPVVVEIVDAEGRVVPTANNLVVFQASGAGSIAGVGNGDPGSHEPDVASQRKAFNGLCMVVIKAGEKPGVIHVAAESEGLKQAQLDIMLK